MRKLAAGGARARVIAAELGRTIEAVRSRAADEAIPLRRPTLPYADSDVATIKAMARAGHPAASIAHAVSRSAHAIRDKCRELGVRLRKSQATGGGRIQLEPAVWTRLRLEAQQRGMRPSRLCQMLLSGLILDRDRSAAVDRALARLEQTPKAIAPPPAPVPLLVVFQPTLLGRC